MKMAPSFFTQRFSVKRKERKKAINFHLSLSLSLSLSFSLSLSDAETKARGRKRKRTGERKLEAKEDEAPKNKRCENDTGTTLNCGKCKYRAVDREDLYIHDGLKHCRGTKNKLRVSPQNVICEICLFSFPSSFDKLSHLIYSHSDFINGFCFGCEHYAAPMTKDAYKVKRHISQKHGENFYSEVYLPQKQLCDAIREGIFSKESNQVGFLLQQMNNSSQKNVFKCPLCSINLSLENREKHVKTCIYKSKPQSLKGAGGEDDEEQEEEEEKEKEPKTSQAPVGFDKSVKVTQEGLAIAITLRKKEPSDNFARDFSQLRSFLKMELKKTLKKFLVVKTSFELAALFRSKNSIFQDEVNTIYDDKIRHIVDRLKEISNEYDIDQLLNEWESYIFMRIENFCEEKSGYIYIDGIRYILRMYKANPLGLASCYIPVSPMLKKKLGPATDWLLINPLNGLKNEMGGEASEKPTENDFFCLLWVISIFQTIRANSSDGENMKENLIKIALGEKLTETVLKREYGKQFEILKQRCEKKKIGFPFQVSKTSLKKLKNALELNSFFINYFGFDHDSQDFHAIHVEVNQELTESKTRGAPNSNEGIKAIEFDTIDILLLPEAPVDGDRALSKCHAMLITDVRGLLCKITKNRNSRFFCRACGIFFKCSEGYVKHVSRDCARINGDQSRLVMPSPRPDGEGGALRAPTVSVNMELGKQVSTFIHFLDLETLLGEKCRNDENDYVRSVEPRMGMVGTFLTVNPHPDESDEMKKIKLDPFPLIAHTGADCVESCLRELAKHAIEVARRRTIIQSEYQSYSLSEQEEQNFKNAKNCDLCGIEFDKNDPKRFKTRHHDHENLGEVKKGKQNGGKLIGFYCASCNGKIKSRHVTDCLIFNLNFDGHFLLLTMLKLNENGDHPYFYKLKLLPSNAEKCFQ